jgi:hypothetical protein
MPGNSDEASVIGVLMQNMCPITFGRTNILYCRRPQINWLDEGEYEVYLSSALSEALVIGGHEDNGDVWIIPKYKDG